LHSISADARGLDDLAIRAITDLIRLREHMVARSLRGYRGPVREFEAKYPADD
jgi:hypothetical protein